MEIKEPQKKGADHIEEDIDPDRTEQYMDQVTSGTQEHLTAQGEGHAT
jgi:hypothetical protein